MAVKTTTSSIRSRIKTKVKRKGIHSKKNSSALKSSKCYKKKYRAQG